MNVQSLNVPVPSEIETAPPYNRTTTKTDTEMPRSGQSSLRLIFHTIIHMRHTTYTLHNIHTRNRNKAAHTQMPPSGKVSLRSILNVIIHMRHTTYRLQNTHISNRNKATHTTTVRCFRVPESDEQRLTSVFEVNMQSLNVPVPSEIETAPPYNGATTKPGTHMPQR